MFFHLHPVWVPSGIHCTKPGLAQEVQRALCMQIMWKGFTTDPDLPGCEKLVMTDLNDKWLQQGLRIRISSADIEADASLIPPQAIFACKGWNRSCCCLLVLKACEELGDVLLKAGLNNCFNNSQGFSLFCFVEKKIKRLDR